MNPAVAGAPVAVIGGGAYAARLVEVIASVPDMPALELRLHARDPGRLDAIASHAAARSRALGAAHRVGAFGDLDRALDGAAAVVLLVRVGGLAARAHDEAFPARFGQVGDEGVGLGGMASAWRTLPVLDRIAARIAARAPGARVLNLIAPLGVTTRLLLERGLRAVGLCELPVLTLERWRAAAGAAEADPPLAYAGLNHLGFFWCPGRPALDHPVLRAAVERAEVPGELARRLDAAPLHYFVDVFEPEAALGAGRRRSPGRALELARLQGDLLRRFRDHPGEPAAELQRRPTPWFEQALVPALHALLGGPTYRGALNVFCAGLLDEAIPQAVVELLGRLGTAGAHIDPVPARPPAVRALLVRLAAAEDLLYRAAAARDRGLLAGALDALPLAWSDAARSAARPELLDCICSPPPPDPEIE
ncbi:MAG TPA: hypothetical protein VKB80_12890, partial [Kofleriaceae bacterium]|nr:hypothetical protein [Kofleriaceae bacterium]